MPGVRAIRFIVLGLLIALGFGGAVRAGDDPKGPGGGAADDLAKRLAEFTCDRAGCPATVDAAPDVPFGDVFQAFVAARAARFEKVEFAVPAPAPAVPGAKGEPPAAAAQDPDPIELSRVSAVAPPPAAGSGAPLVVNVARDGRLTSSGRPVAADALGGFLAAAAEPAGPGPKGRVDRVVRIRADRRAPWGAVSRLMNACASAGWWNLVFASAGPAAADGSAALDDLWPAALPRDNEVVADKSCPTIKVSVPRLRLATRDGKVSCAVVSETREWCTKHKTCHTTLFFPGAGESDHNERKKGDLDGDGGKFDPSGPSPKDDHGETPDDSGRKEPPPGGGGGS